MYILIPLGMNFHIFASILVLPWYTNFKNSQIPILNGYVKNAYQFNTANILAEQKQFQMFLKWKTLIQSYVKLGYEQHCNATWIQFNSIQPFDWDLIEDKWDVNWWRKYSIFKKWRWKIIFFKNSNLKRYFSMPFHLGMG